MCAINDKAIQSPYIYLIADEDWKVTAFNKLDLGLTDILEFYVCVQ